MPPPRALKLLHRAGRWLAGLALLVALPKCLLCVLAWAGLGALLGLGQPELCGAPPVNPPAAALPAGR